MAGLLNIPLALLLKIIYHDKMCPVTLLTFAGILRWVLEYWEDLLLLYPNARKSNGDIEENQGKKEKIPTPHAVTVEYEGEIWFDERKTRQWIESGSRVC